MRRATTKPKAAAVKNMIPLYTAGGIAITVLPSSVVAIVIANVPLWIPISMPMATADVGACGTCGHPGGPGACQFD